MDGSDDRVADAERLWRRVHPKHYQDTGGGLRVLSAAFKGNDLSVDRAQIVEARGQDFHFTKAQGVGVAELLASDYREFQADPIPDPLPDNSAHAIVPGALRDPQAKALARRSKFLS